MGKTKSSKNKTGASSRASTSKAEQPTATDLIGEARPLLLQSHRTLTSLAVTAQAHAYLGQSNFEQAINSLALALDIEPANREAKEILGIAEIEGGDVDKGREVSPRHSILSIMLGARAKS
jgi:Flp pilus assembly protein TadD